MSEHGPQWDRDEAFRNSVIRKAVMLGFEARYAERRIFTHSENTDTIKLWEFDFDGKTRSGYHSLYSAAFDFMRLNNLEYLAGDYRG
jgi:hypothetical protein